ncbi:MAG: prepilin-type N-terminal cleavage/methylation domain-containing protein [Solobacterium sp.]|jgi:type IV pilus assembly protein PilA|nr:prepilin-type N-terminal cleavage/methylation domain-containing protein [Solobacterium sp.]MCH4222086.1 prepilin-type N-terminal cleavage/methylation domain-containing protein [Solobacterium sp.]MCH4265785.1 prepilin-type N-terminal cleavage/methylation domain-containing protein [Solobacterium sp.]
MTNRKNKKGFTLAELLVVVAIIAVLVAVSVPIFTAQLEKAREATDIANMRAAKAEASAEYLTQDTNSDIYKALISSDGAKYDADSGKLVASTATVTGYGKGTTSDGGTTYTGYYPGQKYTDEYIVVKYDATAGTIVVSWSGTHKAS